MTTVKVRATKSDKDADINIESDQPIVTPPPAFFFLVLQHTAAGRLGLQPNGVLVEFPPLPAAQLDPNIHPPWRQSRQDIIVKRYTARRDTVP